VVATFDGQRQRLYVNGRLVREVAQTYFIPSPAPLRLGRDWYGTRTRYFRGAIREVKIWSRALTEEEIGRRG